MSASHMRGPRRECVGCGRSCVDVSPCCVRAGVPDASRYGPSAGNRVREVANGRPSFTWDTTTPLGAAWDEFDRELGRLIGRGSDVADGAGVREPEAAALDEAAQFIARKAGAGDQAKHQCRMFLCLFMCVGAHLRAHLGWRCAADAHYVVRGDGLPPPPRSYYEWTSYNLQCPGAAALLQRVAGSLDLDAQEQTALRGLADTSRMIGAGDGEQDTMLRLFRGTPPVGRQGTAQARDDRLLRDTMALCLATAMSTPRASSPLHMQHFRPGELQGKHAVAFVYVAHEVA